MSKTHRVRAWLPVVIWMALIFTLSSIPDLRSGLQPLWDAILRKLAHATEYGILAWLFFRPLRRHGIDGGFAAILAVVLSVVYAVSDEFHQTFVPGRSGAGLDVVIDSLGASIGGLIVSRLTRQQTPRR